MCLFGIVQLSICEELLCALCIALHCSIIQMLGTLMCILLSLTFDNQHMFYIQQVTMSVWHDIFVMTYSAPLISS